MVEKAVDGTGRDLVDHWSWSAKKGLLNENTAGAFRAACSQVLAVEGDGWEQVDVAKLDVEDILGRFETLRKKDFTPQSLATYRSRFKKAVELYLAFLKDPKNWRPPAAKTRALETDRQVNSKQRDGKGVPDRPDIVEYPFPLREGVLARLTLPIDLRKAEAERLSAFLASLAVEPARALPSPREPSVS